MARVSLTQETRELIRTVRDARFAHGPECPYCAGRVLQRWGTFSGRQRYRCSPCKRTFSDLTGTPLTRTKRIDRWCAFIGCWQKAETVRRTAVQIGVHPTTAFRWRHWLCDAIRESHHVTLRGWVEAAHCTFPYSCKGNRRASAQISARREVCSTPRGRPVSVVILHDRADAIVSAIAGGRRPYLESVIEMYRPHVDPEATLLSRHRRYAPFAAAAHALRIRHVRVHGSTPDPVRHVFNATSYIDSLVAWLERFRGVATAYLPNYLAWHLQVHGSEPARAALMLVRRSCLDLRQQLPRTLPEDCGSDETAPTAGGSTGADSHEPEPG